METFKLSRPVKFDGQEVTELKLNVDDLSYKELRRAERMAEAMCGKKETLNLVKVWDDKYLACVAAVAAGVKPELIFEFKAPDFIQLTTYIRNFLLNGEWVSDEETEETDETANEK